MTKKNNRNVMIFIEVSCKGGAQKVILDIINGVITEGFKPIVVLLKEGWLAREVRKLGFEVIIIRSNNSGFDFKMIYQLIRISKEKNIKLIHAHLFDSGLYACITGLLTGTPVIITLHGQVDWKKKNIVIDFFKAKIINCLANRIIYVSNYLKEFYEKRLKKEKGTVIYNGVDLTQFTNKKNIDYRTIIGVDKSKILVVSIGNIAVWKGYDTLINAIKYVHKNIPNIFFIIVGEYNKNEKYYKKLQEMINMFRLHRYIKFLGSRDDIKDILSCSDIYVLSSIEEGFSISTVEAMAVGLPCVITKCGGGEEVVKGYNKLQIVENRNAKQISEAIEKIVDYLYKKECYNCNYNIDFLQKFSIERLKENYLKIYENACK